MSPLAALETSVWLNCRYIQTPAGLWFVCQRHPSGSKWTRNQPQSHGVNYQTTIFKKNKLKRCFLRQESIFESVNSLCLGLVGLAVCWITPLNMEELQSGYLDREVLSNQSKKNCLPGFHAGKCPSQPNPGPVRDFPLE